MTTETRRIHQNVIHITHTNFTPKTSQRLIDEALEGRWGVGNTVFASQSPFRGKVSLGDFLEKVVSFWSPFLTFGPLSEMFAEKKIYKIPIKDIQCD